VFREAKLLGYYVTDLSLSKVEFCLCLMPFPQWQEWRGY